MFKKRKPYLLTKYKDINSLFLILFSSISLLFGQSNFNQVGVDSVALDAELSTKIVSDSTTSHYLLNPSITPSYYLDSLRSLVFVTDNDFVGWNTRMNQFDPENKSDSVVVLHKAERPLWIIVVLLLLIIFLGLVRVFFRSNFYSVVYGFYDKRIVLQLNKEDTIGTSWPYIFLYIIFTLSLGLFISLFQSYYFQLKTIEFMDFLKISVVISLLFLIKILIIRFLAVLFDVQKISRQYIVFIYLFYFNSILILMPLTLLLIFLPFFYYEYILFFFVIIAVILFLFRFLSTANSLIGDLQFSIFYLILYLCTLEIAPILILVKSLNT